MAATAMLIAFVFMAVYVVVHDRIYADIETELTHEAVRHQSEITLEGGRIRFTNKAEMQEREHREVEVNPIFIQLTDARGVTHDRSPNLKEGRLLFQQNVQSPVDTDFLLNGKAVRQRQMPIMDHGQLVGYIITAVSTDSASQLLGTLRKFLLVSFPVVLLILFGVTRWLAGTSIRPVKTILDTTNQITERNLNERIPLPAQQDELHQLTSSINQLLERIEEALERQKQFTADASHELRTPLSVLRGTLEVLLRKPRTAEEYTEKIRLSIREIDRLHQIVEQLLAIARLDQTNQSLVYESVHVKSFIHDLVQRQRSSWAQNGARIEIECADEAALQTDRSLFEVIMENLLSNAVKYSPENGVIRVVVEQQPSLKIGVHDQGIGIKEDDLKLIFQPFYRSGALDHKEIKGIGLGLSVVQKACHRLGVHLSVSSEPNKGSVFTLEF